MDKYNIILIALALSLAGFRLYRKYYKKDKTATQARRSAFSSNDDDYEPYSGR